MAAGSMPALRMHTVTSGQRLAARISRWGVVIASVCAVAPCAARDGPVVLSHEAIGRVLALGPWPPQGVPDPSNRVTGQPAAIAFGKRMFYNPRVSANGYMACASCHQTDRAWTDSIARAQGLAPVGRNTPTLTNVALQRHFGWGGASDSLWLASLRPMLDAREMGSSVGEVAQVVRVGDGLACEYQRAFGRHPSRVSDETVLVDVAKAIAAFQETLVTGRTAFDEFRDALARGDRQAMAAYPASAQRGLRLFVEGAACAACHSGAAFSNGSLVRSAGDGLEAQGFDADVGKLVSSRYNLLGRFNDGPVRTRARAAATRAVAAGPAQSIGVRVPSLRNVAVTAPYMHDGSIDTLQAAVQHTGLAPLDRNQVEDLVAFLKTLTDADAGRRPQRLPPESSCR